MAATLDFGAFSTAEKQNLLTAAKAELLRRAGAGSVQSGASSNQSFMFSKMTEDALIRTINALTIELGYPQPEVRVRPAFGHGGYAGGGWVPGA